MEHTDILELMSTLKLYDMRAVYDEMMTTGIKRRHELPRIVGDLLSAEIAEKQARSINYQLETSNNRASLRKEPGVGCAVTGLVRAIGVPARGRLC